MEETGGKITKNHLMKKAFLYIRQSTLRQVYENTESTLRQYALREKIYALGWSQEDVVVIDRDLGLSGSEAEKRMGFQELVSEVTNGRVGAVACIECSRLSRSSNDWGRLMEYCAMTNTLLIDADGIYNPNDFNDRLLLGLKGTMSEAELHFLKERMRGGLLNKAKRGELKKPLPIGYLYDDSSRIVKDPGMDIRQAVELFFDIFRIVGTASGMVGYYRRHGYQFPYRVYKGFRKGEIFWKELSTSRTLNILHNPAYAGVYCYGESQTVWTPDGKKSRPVPREECHVFIKDHHEAYITYEEFEYNERLLAENAHPRVGGEGKYPAREGSALLQGLVLCGKCGNRMTVQYHHDKKDSLTPYYVCQRERWEHGRPMCQSIYGASIDEKIAELLIERLSPLAVQLSADVQKEIGKRKEESDGYFKIRVEKCRYEADLARRRYLQVDPDNRMVALELESAWNVRLKELEEARHEYEDRQKAALAESELKAGITLEDLPQNFKSAWHSPNTAAKDRKRMIRYLVEDVTIRKGEEFAKVHIRFRGGTAESLEVPNQKRACEQWKTESGVLEIIRKEAEKHTPKEISVILNEMGKLSGKNLEFTNLIVQRLMRDYGIPTVREHYIEKGYMTSTEKAKMLGISRSSLIKRVADGLYFGDAVKVSDKNEYLFK